MRNLKISVIFFLIGFIGSILVMLTPSGITEEGMHAYCDAKNGIWIERPTYTSCTDDSVSWPEWDGRPHVLPRGHVYVWWDRETGKVQLND